MSSSYLITDELPLLVIVVATQESHLVRGEVHGVLREREREIERDGDRDRQYWGSGIF